MKNMLIAVGTMAVVAFTASVQAVPITGSINFQGGTVTLNGSIADPSSTPGAATAITAFGGSVTVNQNPGVNPTGTFGVISGPDAVSYVMSGFTFYPSLSPAPINALWSFTDATSGLTFSYQLNSVISSIGVGPSLNLQGQGILTITGGSITYDPTPAMWTFSTTGSRAPTFGFVAGNDTNIPDGGTTLTLLGGALAGLGLIKRKFMA